MIIKIGGCIFSDSQCNTQCICNVACHVLLQFVPFREFIGGKYGNDLSRSQAVLAKEVLAEIPDQFVSYMKAKDVKPRPPPPPYEP